MCVCVVCVCVCVVCSLSDLYIRTIGADTCSLAVRSISYNGRDC